MKSWSVLILIVVVAGAFLAYREIASLKSTLQQQQTELESLKKKQAVEIVAPPIELQEKCSGQAQRIFEQLGWNAKGSDSYENHYNPKLNRCFILISTWNATAVTKNLSDAYEGKVYGSYVWFPSKGKKYWEVSPTECWVLLPSGEKATCQLDAEFDNLAKIYMEETQPPKQSPTQ